MPMAIRIHETGGPEVLRWEEVPARPPAAGEIGVRHTAIGLNYIDTYHRSGLYPAGELPAVLGREAAGVVEALGAGVEGWQVGQRVAYPMHPGAYAETANLPAAVPVALPDDIDDRRAAAMMLKGMTAWYLLRRTHRVARGETILFHAVAGGVGSIALQWAVELGATVIGTVGSDEKAERARELGCAHPVVYTRESYREAVQRVTGGRGVPVVYDSVGQATFAESLDCLQPRGLMVSFGNASGAVEPFAIGQLAAKGSLYLTRPTLAHYIARREELEEAAAELFDVVRSGAVRVDVGQEYPLREAAQAHRDLEARRTVGSTLLIP